MRRRPISAAQRRCLVLLARHGGAVRHWPADYQPWVWHIGGETRSRVVDSCIRDGLAAVDGDRVTLTERGRKVAEAA